MPNQAANLRVEIIEEQPLPIAAVVVSQHLQSAFKRYRPTSLASGLVEILITDDAHMQSLNRTHRNVDKTTDVLSLPIAIDSERGMILPSGDQPIHLGTIIISLPQAIRQTGRFGKTLKAELLGLAEHGLRHLLGHDHDESGRWLNVAA